MSAEFDKQELIERALRFVGWNREFSRRGFLKLTGGTIAGLSALSVLAARSGAATPLIIMENAQGLVLGDPTRCVACRRCELACTEYNDGKAAPSMARIKVGRNLNFGAKGAFAGQRAQGSWGNGLVVQDTCKQCPHPVPCATACPNDAIIADPKTGARVVDVKKCIGCKMCQRACPWEMMSFDPDSGKATKCFLCNGKPKCVEACPADALKYVPWRDVTGQVPPRAVPTAVIPPAKAESCNQCHQR